MSQLHLKVVNGTRANETRLCDRCAEGVVMRGSGGNEEVVFCKETRRNVGIHVVECNCFEEGGHPPLWAMREIAWVLDVDSKRQKIGFRKVGDDDLTDE